LTCAKGDSLKQQVLGWGMARDLRGKRILLTGASMGIGRELAKILGSKGAKLALVARGVDKLNETAEEVRKAGGEAVVIPGDLSDSSTPARILDEAVKALGGLDILLNNAGVGTWSHFFEGNEENLRKVFEVNFFSTSELMRLSVKHLIRGNQPAILNIASMTGRRGMPGFSEYSASKHALVGLTEALRAEYHRFGISVLLVLPGLTNSEFFNNVLEKKGKADLPMDKALSPAQTAAAVVKALEKDTRETWLGGEARMILWMNRFMPRWLDAKIGTKVAKLWGKPA
jgi:short-subunit dehydrogenase